MGNPGREEIREGGKKEQICYGMSPRTENNGTAEKTPARVSLHLSLRLQGLFEEGESSALT